MTTEALYDENWLLAYECEYKGMVIRQVHGRRPSMIAIRASAFSRVLGVQFL